jgi:hypothetical protein
MQGESGTSVKKRDEEAFRIRSHLSKIIEKAIAKKDPDFKPVFIQNWKLPDWLHERKMYNDEFCREILDKFAGKRKKKKNKKHILLMNF